MLSETTVFIVPQHKIHLFNKAVWDNWITVCLAILTPCLAGSPARHRRKRVSFILIKPRSWGRLITSDRLNLKPNYDYRFLGDAAFDTRYVSNVVLNQTGSRYLNGIGSELDQMRYLMDNAASAQRALGLQFGVSLSAQQVASLDKSIVWWEAATINGETVMVPKVYLSSKDVKMHDGSVIAGNNVTLSGGDITNSGSTITAKNNRL